MKKLTEARTCPTCGGSRIAEARVFSVLRPLARRRVLRCVECGTTMSPRRRGRWFLFI